MSDLVDDTTPELGGDLGLNGNSIDFPTTPNISDCLDEDNMASDSATKLCTQQSIKAYADAISGGEITAFTDAWKNYNDVDTTAEITIPTTKNYFLCGPISVTGAAVWTISGILRII